MENVILPILSTPMEEILTMGAGDKITHARLLVVL
jgi:hypothetical protein